MKYSMNNSEDHLEHFGILGMRWGRRKGPSESSGPKRGGLFKKKSSQGSEKEEESEDYKKTTDLRKKKAKQLSNAELQTVITRLNLERQYAEVTKKQISAGQKYMAELMTGTAKRLTGQYVNQFADKGAAALVGKVTKVAA